MDFALKYLALVPDYFRDLVALLGSPKAFLTDRASESSSTKSRTRCLVFFGLSALIAYFLKLEIKVEPLARSGSFLNFAQFVVLVAVGFTALAVATRISWRLVGRRIPFETLFQTQIYILSVAMLLGNALAVVFYAVGLALFPAAYLEIMRIIGHHNIAEIRGGVVQDEIASIARKSSVQTWMQVQLYARITMWIFFGVLTGWFILTWGTFRLQLASSRRRSSAALVLYLFLAWIVVALVSYMVGVSSGS